MHAHSPHKVISSKTGQSVPPLSSPLEVKAKKQNPQSHRQNKRMGLSANRAGVSAAIMMKFLLMPNAIRCNEKLRPKASISKMLSLQIEILSKTRTTSVSPQIEIPDWKIALTGTRNNNGHAYDRPIKASHSSYNGSSILLAIVASVQEDARQSG